MKVTELDQLIEQIIFKEVKKTILNESEQKEVYQLSADGEPVGVYDTQQEAESEKEKIQGLKPGQELIIDKVTYESYSDMLEKLDKMGEELEETNNMEEYTQENNEELSLDAEIETSEGNEFSAALMKAKEEGKDKFTVGGKEYDVKECWSKMEEEEMGEETNFVDRNDFVGVSMEEEGEVYEGTPKTCDECGSMLNEEGMCMECNTMKESKKTLKITETKLVSLIKSMVVEAMKGVGDTRGVSGKEQTQKAQRGSAKENQQHMKDVEKKMKDYLKFDGNDNPEFPHQVGKGEKMAINLTDKQDEEVDQNKAGLQNLQYDIEPSDKFKERLRMAIEGDSKMGNAPTTPVPSLKPSNTSEKGKQAKEKIGNVVNSEKAEKKLKKQITNRDKEKKDRVWYNKQAVPVKSTTNESKKDSEKVLKEELVRIKNLTGYNKKTQ